jgi:hypothetical protein
VNGIRRDADGRGRERAQARSLDGALTRDRLDALPALCDRLVAQAAITPADAELAMRGLPQSPVMHLAIGLRSVARVVASLPPNFPGWAP